MYQDRFGYVPVSGRIEWEGGKIGSLPGLEEVTKSMQSRASTDGYLYPQHVQGSGRPSFLYRLPASHSVEIFDVSGDQGMIRKAIGGFIMHLTGFFFGHRCQFEDWWADGRVSIKSEADFSFVQFEDVGVCFTQATKAWSTWPEREQRVAMNALFLHNRVACYMWDWERFQSQYTVLDACYKLASACHGVKATRHEDRIAKLCEDFGLKLDAGHISKIVSLRNDLVHEALWEGGMPGEARSTDSFMAAYWLHNLCARLFFALFNIEAEYVHSLWWGIDSRVLKPRYP